LYTQSIASLPVLPDARALLEELGIYSAVAAATPSSIDAQTALYADPLTRIDRGFVGAAGSGAARLRPESSHLEEELRAGLSSKADAMGLILTAIARALAPCVMAVALQAATIKDDKALPGQKFTFERRTFLKGQLAVAGVSPETARDVVALLARACKSKSKAEEVVDLDLWIWNRGSRASGDGQSGDALRAFSGRGCRRIRTDIPGACVFVPLSGSGNSLAPTSTEAIRMVLSTSVHSTQEEASGLADLFSAMQSPARYSDAVEACPVVDIEAADLPLSSRRDQFAARACFDCLRHVRVVHGRQRVGHPQLYSCDDSAV
jgi:hypothetical protein